MLYNVMVGTFYVTYIFIALFNINLFFMDDHVKIIDPKNNNVIDGCHK